MIKAYKFRIYPNKEQQGLLCRTFGCVRYVWNHFLARKENAFESNETGITYNKMSSELTVLKAEYEWLKEPDKCALQNAVKNLSKAYDRFFQLQKVGPKYTQKKLQHLARIERQPNRMDLNGHPQFKRLRDNQKSYTTNCTNNNIAVLDKHIKLPKLGRVRYRDKRHYIEGKILSATVSQEPSGKYYVSICCKDVPETHVALTNKSAGIDLGIKEFLITSDGHKVPNHKFLKKKLKKLKRLQKALSRKTRNSANWNRNKKQLAILHEKIRHARLDFQHKVTTELVRNYDLICLETLKVKNMIKNHKLAQAISDVAWSQFVELLRYKMTWNNKRLVQIDTYFPSSQTCSECGYINKETKDLSVREWICPQCGTYHDRDINAAKNILTEGLKIA